MRYTFNILIALVIFLFLACQKERELNYTVVVSLDGMRWDYPLLYSMPQFNAMVREGVSADMMPCYPASTYPNHYSLATGLYPDHHGIVSNNFWDTQSSTLFSYKDSVSRNNPFYYGGEPIWKTAEQQGLKTATIYWVGGGLNVADSLSSYHLKWQTKGRMKFSERMDYALNLLRKPERERPRLLMLYMEQPDEAGHKNGPKSDVTAAVTNYCDSMLGKLYDGIRKLPYAKKVNVIVVSDHGMTDLSPERMLFLDDYIPQHWVVRAVNHSPTFIYAQPGYTDSIMNALNKVSHIKAWRRGQLPDSLHYGNNPRVGDIVVAPGLGWFFSETFRKRDKNNVVIPINNRANAIKGEHGYGPWNRDMQVPFCALGPDFKKGYRAKNFPNIDIYSLLAYLLNIEPAQTDGSLDRVKDMISDE